jgi:hypothetical protein
MKTAGRAVHLNSLHDCPSNCTGQILTQRRNYPERFPHLFAPNFYVYCYGARVSTQQNFKQGNLSTWWQVTRILVAIAIASYGIGEDTVRISSSHH